MWLLLNQILYPCLQEEGEEVLKNNNKKAETNFMIRCLCDNLLSYRQIPWDRSNIYITTNRIVDFLEINKHKAVMWHGFLSVSTCLAGALFPMPDFLRYSIITVAGVNLMLNILMCGIMNRPNVSVDEAPGPQYIPMQENNV